MWRSVYLVTDVSVQSSWTVWPLKKGPIDCLKTSVIINQRCVKSQKSEHVSYTSVEIYDLSQCYTRVRYVEIYKNLFNRKQVWKSYTFDVQEI
jgi:hypothetical protein